MRFRTLLAILLVAGLAVWVGGALNFGEWVVLVVLGVVVLGWWTVYEVRHPMDDPADIREREMFVPVEWDEDESSIRHRGLGK